MLRALDRIQNHSLSREMVSDRMLRTQPFQPLILDQVKVNQTIDHNNWRLLESLHRSVTVTKWDATALSWFPSVEQWEKFHTDARRISKQFNNNTQRNWELKFNQLLSDRRPLLTNPSRDTWLSDQHWSSYEFSLQYQLNQDGDEEIN